MVCPVSTCESEYPKPETKKLDASAGNAHVDHTIVHVITNETRREVCITHFSERN